MRANECIVTDDYGLVVFDEADTSHVGRYSVHLVDTLRCAKTIRPVAQVQLPELMRCTSFILRVFYIYATYPVASCDEISREVMSNEAARSRYQNSACAIH